MPVTFDSTGWERVDEHTWWDPRTGDAVALTPIGLVPDLPPLLHDVPALRRQLAVDMAPYGTLVEADVVLLDGMPAVYQLARKPLPDRPSGAMYHASFIVPRANCSVVLMMQAAEGEYTGFRETTVATEVGPQHVFRPHPYAPDLWWSVADDPSWDPRFPDHPLTRARAWAHRTMATARVDPRFPHLPPFPAPPGAAVPAPNPTPVPTGQLGAPTVTVLLGLPVGDLICLSHDDDGSSFWRLADPNVLPARAGLGELERVEVPGRGPCEVAVLAPGAGLLYLVDGQPTPVSPVDPAQALEARPTTASAWRSG